MKYAWISALALTGLLQSATVVAQDRDHQDEHRSKRNEETVELDQDNDGPTVIEIRNGGIWINGEKVATEDRQDQTNRKIIVTHNDQTTSLSQRRGYRDDAEAPPASGKATLGVIIAAQPSRDGAYVRQVMPNSPAQELGLQTGDLITGVNDRSVAGPGELVEAIHAYNVGDKVDITYERKGQTRTGKATLVAAASLEQPEPEAMPRMFRFGPDRNNDDFPELFRSFPFNGDDIREPAPQMGVSAEDRADGNGVTLLEVKPGSPAAQAGLRTGDIVLKLDDRKIGSVDELQQALRSVKPNEKTPIEYQRNGQAMTGNIILPRPLHKKEL